MKKVLTIIYTYPPVGGAGTVRSVKFIQYLPRFGWKAVVLAPSDAPSSARWGGGVPQAEVIYTQYIDIFGPLRKRAGHLAVPREHMGAMGRRSMKTRLAWALNEFVAIPDSRIGWYPYAVRGGIRRVHRGDISVIYSSSPPETTHLIAKTIHRYTGIPWVAELRDLWTQNPFYIRSPIRLWVERWLERRTLKEANTVVSVTKGFCMQLQDIVREGPIYLVRNGIDPEDFALVPAVRVSKFTIVFMGTLYYPDEDPLPFLRALKGLIRRGEIPEDDIEVRFYGTNEGPWIRSIEKHPLSYVVSFHKRVSYRKSIAIQKGCGAILLFLSTRPTQGIHIKLYEAIGSGRPILAISSERSGEPVDILRCSSMAEVVSDEREIREALLRLYKIYVTRGKYSYYIRREGQVTQFSWQEAARALAEVLDRTRRCYA